MCILSLNLRHFLDIPEIETAFIKYKSILFRTICDMEPFINSPVDLPVTDCLQWHSTCCGLGSFLSTPVIISTKTKNRHESWIFGFLNTVQLNTLDDISALTLNCTSVKSESGRFPNLLPYLTYYKQNLRNNNMLNKSVNKCKNKYKKTSSFLIHFRIAYYASKGGDKKKKNPQTS